MMMIGINNVTLFVYRRRGDVFEPWLRQPTFLKTVQGEDVWIETYLKENRCAREREANPRECFFLFFVVFARSFF
jgi:hypothetical protein